MLRLVCLMAAVLLFYQTIQHGQFIWLIAGGAALAAFALMVKYHQTIRWHARFIQEKMGVNQKEVDFLHGKVTVFDNGHEFTLHDHPFSYDLDFFGDHSLYQFLNRTTTVSGKRILAETLLHLLPRADVLARQEAIKELATDLEWRHSFSALAQMNPDSEESVKDLIAWSQQPPVRISRIVRIVSFVLPALTLLCFGYYLNTGMGLAGNVSGLLFLVNLGILGAYGVSIKSELVDTTKIEKILRQYSFMLHEIEQRKFASPLLTSLQKPLHQDGSASQSIRHLALLFGRMEHVANVFASPILNGSLLFHLHVLHHLSQWRRNYAGTIKQWLEVIGTFESLSSLANYQYNNPSFTYPQINEQYQIQFEDLGHPLLSKETAVTNSVNFNTHRFFILTGSNMSGKSTFLRTIGVNMILAGIGAPVFATKANVHPLPVHVSMRLSDSLTDSESYFYAEVKRLKAIMDELERGPCFVLLDEILRGTNSDDKRDGTIEVIRKMAAMHAIGGIATHDLEVCKTASEHPDILTNKRFEVEIVNDELVFDYQLREGVCQNKSASFIMKKMGVI